MNPPHDTTSWPQNRVVAARLREELAELGLTEDETRQIIPTADIDGREQVRLGTTSVDSADKLAAALYAARAARARL
jgi:hypothetical protein